jgi:hypothetical protein
VSGKDEPRDLGVDIKTVELEATASHVDHTRLYLRQLVEEARQDVREGRVFTHEEVEREAARWIDP